MTALLKRVKRAFEPMTDDMTSTKHHIKQIERRREPDVDSEVVSAPSMYAVVGSSYAEIEAHGPFCPLSN